MKLNILKDDPEAWRLLLSTIPKSMPIIERIIGDYLLAAIHNTTDGYVTLTTDPSEDFFS